MTAIEMATAAATIRASQHPAAREIADLLDTTAAKLAIRETNWDANGYDLEFQTDLTNSLWGHEIAIAHALTAAGVGT